MYSINTGTGTLAALSGSPLATGSSPESLAVDPAGRFLYAANVTGANEVTSYSITPSSGALTRGIHRRVGHLPAERRRSIRQDSSLMWRTRTPTTSRSTAINSTTGALTPVPGSPFAAGVNPRAVALD